MQISTVFISKQFGVLGCMNMKKTDVFMLITGMTLDEELNLSITLMKCASSGEIKTESQIMMMDVQKEATA